MDVSFCIGALEEAFARFVRVEHVMVNAGGQAIVGNVTEGLTAAL
jgi:hypothetical protein